MAGEIREIIPGEGAGYHVVDHLAAEWLGDNFVHPAIHRWVAQLDLADARI